MRTAVAVLAYFAVTVTAVDIPTGLVVTANVVVVLPGGTTTELGIVATDELLLVKVTEVPPLGAGVLSVTVP